MNRSYLHTITRRSVLTKGLAGAVGVSGWLGPAAAPAKPVARRAFRNGLCATQFAEGELRKGITYRAGRLEAGSMLELQRLMMAYGSNEVFARVGSSRTAGTDGSTSMDSALRRAKLAKAVDLPLNPEFLLCARYGDMGGQPEPDLSGYPEIKLSKPWAELEIEEMCDAMRLYGQIFAREIVDTGVTVNVWDIGNEVEWGIAGVAIPPFSPGIGGPGWSYRPPDKVDPEIGKMNLGRFFMMSASERVAWGSHHLWNYVGQILAAVAEGIKQVEPRARFATHASAIASLMPEVFVGFYRTLDAQGFKVEDVGVSYYPTNTKAIADRFEKFKATATLARQQLDKPVYVAEFGYAAGPVSYGGQNWANPVDGYPISLQGQGDFLRDLTEWGAANGTLSGIRPWAPDYVGAEWQGMALFDAPLNGVAVARPGLSSIREGLIRA